jgi:hypothetical protein
LLKVVIASHSGGERILAFLGPAPLSAKCRSSMDGRARHRWWRCVKLH